MKNFVTHMMLAVLFCLSMGFTAKAQTIVFSEDFENTSIGAIPAGWTQVPPSAAVNWAVIDDGYDSYNCASLVCNGSNAGCQFGNSCYQPEWHQQPTIAFCL